MSKLKYQMRNSHPWSWAVLRMAIAITDIKAVFGKPFMSL